MESRLREGDDVGREGQALAGAMEFGDGRDGRDHAERAGRNQSAPPGPRGTANML